MDLQIAFDPEISVSTVSRLIIRVGDASIRSYPMSAEDHYRDLFVIKHFLGRQTLTSIILGNEPVATVEFSKEGDVVTFNPYKRLGGNDFSSNFRLSQGVSQIDQALNNLLAMISTDRAFLKRQAFDDIDAGAYAGCEAEPRKAK